MVIAIDQLLTPDIHKPARYIGNELGAAYKSWSETQVHWVLSYPELYELGSSNLGHQILYNIINAQPRQLCDRTYLPGPDLSAKLRETQTPLFALESRRALQEFDIIGFSLSYELGATNILEMLDLARIPLTWEERNQGDFPLVFAGGQTATSNPEPYAQFFDFMALGDGEELLTEIGLIVEEGLNNTLSRLDLLLDLAQIPGVYVPQFYQPMPDGSVVPLRDDVPDRILRRTAPPMPAYSVALVPYIETIHDRLTMEIRRGCTRGCRFCQPGMLTRPARDVDPDAVIEAIEQGIQTTGYNEISLLSLSCSDYLALPAVGLELRNRLQEKKIALSLPSQRVDRFDENIGNIVGGTRKSSLTFAPEAGTQRMRDIINKGLTNEELLRGVKSAYDQGWDRVKLYFMIGLPGETDADVLGIAETVHWLQQECYTRTRKRLGVTLTISNFTPKPHTPFQWHSVSTAAFARKQDLLREEFRQMRGVKAHFTDIRLSAMEDFLSRGDRQLGPVILEAWKRGAGMDAWWESLDTAYNAWEEAIDRAGLTWKYRQITEGTWHALPDHLAENTSSSESLLDQPLPWDHIDTGITKTWLKDDLKRALEATTVPDCSFDSCSHCGVCGTNFGHNIVVTPPPIPALEVRDNTKVPPVQRLRVKWGKQGEMGQISHLDWLRLLDRAVRRAGLPVSYSGGYHPGPRIMVASALSLGITSSGELVDFELTQPVAPEDFLQRLRAQLPAECPLYEAIEVPLKGKSSAKLLERAEYQIILECSVAVTSQEWQDWIESILDRQEIIKEGKTKSGKRKRVNLREQLFELELESFSADGLAHIRYLGSCRNDGTLLRPMDVVYLFEFISRGSENSLDSPEFSVRHTHRKQLILSDE
ncbi:MULTISPECIES: TIGR03960 family B12-binding radical SAM protein [unclassified Roseofilum]|uniref:TIGR03960 family B12-binding radical SAM protein n=1 Tax=unclassified Roseofilum TaxID=2620099 RepID=UPI000E83109F|nr:MULTISPECIES: TIGR03960 family B12-binding radical SAM protein [unclassified Roseofilum]MBP0008259.1 TIGR03960 family B12-binding radical SAM protein [Roseofilum sp. Belize Diploria]MBP0032770.1 TIGR03960 family B12-binding radical SAM protein [Roseofilum sp. Belize BBD 4]HBR00894.1 TIGR03960 family B12-binding radical SAM protein [Cyanobacteria bacterium UBA11691]